ncbi:MAG: GGDEF domain-containing protein [Nitrospirae bacterium]|nr:GGDEF domain-containing protein [Nitrospirota bacterium]
MFSILLLSILVISLGANAVLFLLFHRKQRQNKKLKEIYNNLNPEAGIEKMLKVISEDLSGFGLKIKGIFVKNRKTMSLEDDTHSIPVLQHNTMVRSFLTMDPIPNDELGDNEADNFIKEKYGGKLSFLPVNMKWEGPCWQVNDCNDTGCSCYHKQEHKCWVKSDKRYRGDDLKTYKEKTARCMNCRSFLPVGVFAVTGRGVTKAHKYISDDLSGIIRNAVIYERAQYSATRDQLTGLFNRRTLFKRAYELMKLSQRYKHPFCLCMFDIDHFKRFNDEYGHEVGDYVLKVLSKFVLSCIRTTDVFGRYGGEEFTILLPETKKEEAFTALDKIRNKVDREIFEYKDVKHHIQISMGLTELHQDEAVSLSDLFKKADDALYQSKQGGRNMVTSYIDGFPAAPKKDAIKSNNADRQESAGKKKIPTNRTASAKSKGISKESGGGASRNLNEILAEHIVKPERNLCMDPSDQDETIEIG